MSNGIQSAYSDALENVSHPVHYTSVVPGIECIEVTQHFNFNRGNAIKYLWRAGQKNKQKEIEDLQKARQYIDFEIDRIRKIERLKCQNQKINNSAN